MADNKPVPSYNNPGTIGTSYQVPLTIQDSYNAPAPENSISYSVSADDLERSSSQSNISPVYSSSYSSSYSVNGIPNGVNDNSDATTIVKGETVQVPAASETVDQLEERDGAGGHHHHEHEGEHSQDHGTQAVEAPAQSYTPVSTGHLYYYYYPVAAEPIVKKADTSNEVDPLVAVLLPITILVGILAIISIINGVANTGRSLYARSFGGPAPMESTFGAFTDLQEEIDTMLVKYYQVLEDDSCMDRLLCELGTKAQNLAGRDYLMTALDWLAPEAMSKKIYTFKFAVKKNYTTKQCMKKYSCKSPYITDMVSRK
jgi:hypothetical protein